MKFKKQSKRGGGTRKRPDCGNILNEYLIYEGGSDYVHWLHVYYMLLNKKFDIGTVICPRDSRIKRLLREQVTVPISNLLFNDNFITLFLII